MLEEINTIVCTCSSKDLSTWKVISKQIPIKIKSKNYLVIVPDHEESLFIKNTDINFIVKKETLYVGNLKKKLKKKIPKFNENRVGWYLQQFVKFSAIKNIAEKSDDNDVILLWDADTLPLKKLFFTNSKKKILFYKSKEFHKPYFSLIKKITGLDKIENASFISQSFAARSRWINFFFKYIEKKNNQDNWINIFLDKINFNESSGLSEYETLGTFISHFYKKNYEFIDRPWLRSGNRSIGSLNNIEKFPFNIFLKYYDFVSFEVSEASFAGLKKLFSRFKLKFIFNLFKKKKSNFIDQFLKNYFDSNEKKTIVQIGANDGIQNDPLRKFLKQKGNYDAILIEPIPYYVNKLKILYKNRSDIKIIQAAVASKNKMQRLYFIKPEIADMMNGDGPNNNWAHGQGSFIYENIVHYIKQNSFRGKKYRFNIPLFISSITSLNVKTIKTSDLISKKNNVLLVIDVQGFEIKVLSGINFNKPPKYILVEDDLPNNEVIKNFLNKKKYKFLGGTTDKLFAYNE